MGAPQSAERASLMDAWRGLVTLIEPEACRAEKLSCLLRGVTVVGGVGGSGEGCRSS